MLGIKCVDATDYCGRLYVTVHEFMHAGTWGGLAPDSYWCYTGEFREFRDCIL